MAELNASFSCSVPILVRSGQIVLVTEVYSVCPCLSWWTRLLITPHALCFRAPPTPLCPQPLPPLGYCAARQGKSLVPQPPLLRIIFYLHCSLGLQPLAMKFTRSVFVSGRGWTADSMYGPPGREISGHTKPYFRAPDNLGMCCR